MLSYNRFLITLSVGLSLAACGNPPPDAAIGENKAPKPTPQVVAAQDAIGNPGIPTIDPMSLDDAEVDKLLANTPRCSFSYTAADRPVLVTGVADNTVAGVIKIHGKLVKLAGNDENVKQLHIGGKFTADPITIDVQPRTEESTGGAQSGEAVPAEMRFELSQGLKVGYEGWLSCKTR